MFLALLNKLLILIFIPVIAFAQTESGGRPPSVKTELDKFPKPIELDDPRLNDKIKLNVALKNLRKSETEMLKTINLNSKSCKKSGTNFKDLTQMHLMLSLGEKSSNKKEILDCFDCSVKKDPTLAQKTSLAYCFVKIPDVRKAMVNFMYDEYIKIYLSQEYGYDNGQVDYIFKYYRKLFEETNLEK